MSPRTLGMQYGGGGVGGWEKTPKHAQVFLFYYSPILSTNQISDYSQMTDKPLLEVPSDFQLLKAKGEASSKTDT